MKYFLPNIWNSIGTLLVAFFVVPFITYDTGIRCITTPCPSSDTGTLFEYLLKRGEIFDIEYGIFILTLILIYVTISFLYKKQNDKKVI